MLNPYRKNFFTLFAVFFVISLPFLLIFSLGYELNFESQSIKHSLTVQLETVPRNAVIKSQTRQYKTPLEIRIGENMLTQIELNLQNYHSESFIFSSLQENTALRLRDIWLLPTDPFLEFDLKDYTFLNFLSQDYVLLEKDGEVFIQNIGFSGMQSQPSLISIQNHTNLSESRFEILLGDVFWHPLKQILIYSQPGSSDWQVFDLNLLPFSAVSMASLSSFQVLILDNYQNLWVLDLESFDFTFIDSGFNALSFTENPDMLWLLKKDSIFRLERQQNNQRVELRNLNTTRNKYTTHPIFGRRIQGRQVLSYQDFTVRNIFLGFSFEIQKRLFYVDDSNKSGVLKITNQATKTGASSNTLFWLDQEMNLNSYNLLHNNYRHLSNLKHIFQDSDFSKFRIFYYKRWNRIMIYNQNKVVSYWFDTFNLNSSLISYRPILWIDDKKCFQEVFRNYQFCFNQNQGYFYRNNTFFR